MCLRCLNASRTARQRKDIFEYPHYAVDFKALKKYYDGKAVAERYELAM